MRAPWAPVGFAIHLMGVWFFNHGFNSVSEDRRRRDDLFRVVGAGVPDYQEFPVAKGLPANAFNRQRKNIAAIVSGRDN